MPVVFLRGPSIPFGRLSGFNRVKAISDALLFNWIPSPEDSQTWRYHWDVDIVNSSYYDFGTKYCADHWNDGGLWPDNHQPRSGAANIYDQLLKGYEYLVNNNYTSSDTIYRVVAQWEPGCTLKTYYKGDTLLEPDTIFISGDTTGQVCSYYTDEWDDLFLLHEYGHHVINRCVEWPPVTPGISHYWHKATLEDTLVGYNEGWPTMFAGVVTGNNYMVDTRGMIGDPNDTTAYFNIENPWDFRVIPPFPSPADSFEGGPYCEGAVCGALRDIYDATDEIPYPSYPYPGFPDTSLADSLTMGFEEIWSISDNYEWLGHHCWTIHDFLRGWGEYHYDHQFGFNQVVLHHRILWDVPAAPVGLQANYAEGIPGVVLTWRANTEPDLYKYFVYRKLDYPESSFVMIGAPFPGLDTNFVDMNVEIGESYWYAVTAMDSSSFESQLSDSVMVEYGPRITNDSLATAYNNGRKIMSNPGGDQVHIVYSSDGIYYCYSSDSGKSFSTDEYIGPGLYPSLALNTAEEPYASWISDSILYYSYLDTYWTSTNIVMPVELSQPSMIVDAFDTVHMVLCRYDVQGSDYGDFLYLKFPRMNFEYMVIETLLVNNFCRTPSLAKDFSGDINTLWQGENCFCSQSKDIAGWSEIDTIYTTTSNEALYPVLDIYGSTITAVWQDKDVSDDLQIYSRMKHDNDWETIKQVASTTGDSRYPSLASSYYCLWQDNTPGNWEVYKSEYIGTIETWAAPENISSSSTGSKYPHGFCTVINGTARLYALWTKGDESPFSVKIYSSTFTPSGYVLNLDSFPMYEAEPDPGYNEMCGPAVAQMALNYMFWNNITHPDSVPMLPEFAQDLLYEYGIEHNSDPELEYFDLQGMWHTIQDKKPMPYSEYGYNFTRRHSADQYKMLKLICQWIDYPVGTVSGDHKEGYPWHVPSIVPAYGDYTNWMAIRGIHTDVSAYPMPDTLIIYGFWVNDPLPGGIGENSYKTAQEFVETYYATMSIGDYQGEYVAVLEPPESVEGCHLIIAEPIPRFTGMQNQLMNIPDPNVKPIDWITQAAIDGVTEHLIPYDKKFAELFVKTSPSKPLFAQSMNGNDYYIVPFRLNNPMPKITKDKAIKEVRITTKIKKNSDIKDKSKIKTLSDAKGTGRVEAISDTNVSTQVETLRLAESILIDAKEKISVVILIDANDGSFKEASWTYTPVKYLPISKEQAQQIAFEVATEQLGLEIDDINELQPKLIHRKSTPYYPEWRVIIEEYAIYINQDGSVTIEEFVAGEQGNGGIMSEDEGLSFVYSLNAAAPTPFVKNTTISYSIAKPGEVSLNIYDINGRLIKTLVDDKKDAGIYSVRWNGCDNNNREVATGVYFTRLTSGNFTSVKKVILVR